jgi:hypothetical protein
MQWWRPAACCSHKNSAWVASLAREAQAAEAVDDELKASKANGFTKVEATARQVFTVGGDGKHWWVNHQNIQRK